MSKLTMVKGLLKGLNWQALLYKAGAYVLVAGTIATVSYREGKNACEIAARDKQIKDQAALVVQEREYIREALAEQQAALSRRLQTVDNQTKAGAQIKSDLQYILEQIDEEITKRSGRAGCSPTNDELRKYDRIAEKTRTGK